MGRTRQVLLNLLSNAVKFTEDGGVRLMVDAKPVGDDAVDVRIRVEDTGIGIAADKLSRVFDVFCQADSSTTREFGGTGLGLTISRELAQAMDGDLTAESEPGVGSTFTFGLRAGLVAEQERQELEARVDGPAERVGARLAGRHVLVTDDNAVNRKVVTKMLEKLGAQVTVAGNGAEAVAALSDGGPFDVVLMDHQMPVMDGPTATRTIRGLGAGDLPLQPVILALTANAHESDRTAALGSGADGFLTKPITLDQLREGLEAALQAAPSRQPSAA